MRCTYVEEVIVVKGLKTVEDIFEDCFFIFILDNQTEQVRKQSGNKTFVQCDLEILEKSTGITVTAKIFTMRQLSFYF